MIKIGNTAEFGLHLFKRRASGDQLDRYTIGVWQGAWQRAICHDACLDAALAAIRLEMENAGTSSGTSSQLRDATKERISNGHQGANLTDIVDMADAPLCLICGVVCFRSGACFRCLNCGSTTGCG